LFWIKIHEKYASSLAVESKEKRTKRKGKVDRGEKVCGRKMANKNIIWTPLKKLGIVQIFLMQCLEDVTSIEKTYM
jgi:hypothetical protein